MAKDENGNKLPKLSKPSDDGNKLPKVKKSKQAPHRVPERHRDLLTEVTRKATGATEQQLPPVAVAGPNNYAAGTREALLEVVRTPKRKRKITQLDQIILQNGNASVPWSEIGRLTGLPPLEARARYLEIAREFYDMSPADQMLIQTARLEGVINLLQQWAQAGSEDHIRLLLDAIKQLREIHGLANNKTEIIVRVLVDAQADIIVKAMQHFMAKLFDNWIVSHAIASDPDGNPRQLPEVIDAIAVEALGEVQELVEREVDRQVVAGVA